LPELQCHQNVCCCIFECLPYGSKLQIITKIIIILRIVTLPKKMNCSCLSCFTFVKRIRHKLGGKGLLFWYTFFAFLFFPSFVLFLNVLLFGGFFLSFTLLLNLNKDCCIISMRCFFVLTFSPSLCFSLSLCLFFLYFSLLHVLFITIFFLSFCLSASLSFYISVFLSFCLSVFLSFCLCRKKCKAWKFRLSVKLTQKFVLPFIVAHIKQFIIHFEIF